MKDDKKDLKEVKKKKLIDYKGPQIRCLIKKRWET